VGGRTAPIPAERQPFGRPPFSIPSHVVFSQTEKIRNVMDMARVVGQPAFIEAERLVKGGTDDTGCVDFFGTSDPSV